MAITPEYDLRQPNQLVLSGDTAEDRQKNKSAKRMLENPQAGRMYPDSTPNTTRVTVDVRVTKLIFDAPSEVIGTLYKLMKELGTISLALAAIAAIKLIDHLQNNIKSAAKTAKH